MIAPDDPVEAIEFCYRRGWTDGLPVVPPTERRVREMLEASGRDAQEVLGLVPPRRGLATVEKVAINAVMAGCLPAYMPVVLTAVEAVLDEAFNLHACCTSTKGAMPLLIINGPLSRELGFNSKGNVFGPASRANATVGRAIRLIARNLGGAFPGDLDRGTLGHPGRYTYCIAENEEENPWEPLHVERGFSADVSTVFAFAAEAPHQINNQYCRTPQQVLGMMADSMGNTGNFSILKEGVQGEFVVVLCPEHAGIIASAGWSKTDVKQYLFENARQSVGRLKETFAIAREIEPGDYERLVPIVNEPQHIIVIVAGGAGRFSAHIPRGASVDVHRSIIRAVGGGPLRAP